MEAAERARAFRRVARIVHPDKCHHPFAKEAFQRLFNCSRRLTNKSGKSLYSYYIIRILKKTTPFIADFTNNHSTHHDDSTPTATEEKKGFFYDVATAGY